MRAPAQVAKRLGPPQQPHSCNRKSLSAGAHWAAGGAQQPAPQLRPPGPAKAHLQIARRIPGQRAHAA
eukprot:10437719-Lingulodinium_polyedra.AAC.1